MRALVKLRKTGYRIYLKRENLGDIAMILRINLSTGGDSYDDVNSDPTIIAGNDGADVIDGGGGSDFILGNQGDDIIDGGTGRDVLYGGRGNDTMFGGSGFDFLSGDFGADTLSGNKGADTFYFNARTATEVDTITDFSDEDGDKILLDGFAGAGSAVATTGGTNIMVDGNVVAFLDGYFGAVTIEAGPPDYSDYTPF